jgi:hypothetical protein
VWSISLIAVKVFKLDHWVILWFLGIEFYALEGSFEGFVGASSRVAFPLAKPGRCIQLCGGLNKIWVGRDRLIQFLGAKAGAGAGDRA